MLLSACEEFDIDMDNSIMIGDKTDDMTAATTANVGTKILVRTGKPVTEQGEALASVVLDSVADVPAWLAAR
jgi:D-glycero-D-manno-heptose 1,7-bisphosphate phosphatase